MPDKDQTSKPTIAAGQDPSDADKALREDWGKLSHEDKDTYFKSLSADDQVNFATRVGMFDSKLPVSVSAPPATGSIPWMKEKALSFVNGGANMLPTLLGTAGGLFGAGVGEGLMPAGGGAYGAVVGAGAGGSAGEGARQYIQHKTGLDQFEDPKTVKSRVGDIALQGGEQALSEAFGQGAGRLLRPTLEKSLAKLYNAGGIGYGDGMGEGRLKSVIDELHKTEKAPGGKAVTIKDLVGVVGETLKDVGARADASLDKQVTSPTGHTVLLRDMTPNPTPLSTMINDMATKDEGVVKRASLAGSDPSIRAAKKYQQMVKDRALTFQQKPWTYGELAKERMRINQMMDSYYGMTPGEKQAFLKQNPLLEVDKKIADYIRDVSYPEMDKAAGYPPGTTKELQTKRGILMGMDTEVRKNLEMLQDKTVKAKGEGIVDKVSPSAYLTSEGKPGGSFHRIQRLVHTPNGIASADKKVSQAFGHAPLTAARKFVTGGGNIQSATAPLTPMMNAADEIWALPARMIANPSLPEKPEADKTPGPQSSATKPKELIERAKSLNPAAQGQVAYAHTAVNPVTGHRIASHDGITWVDEQTGTKVA